ncbi:LytR/AlgR family response regulator transcription factor [Taibaiella koreensis]|uniref:LytR/AlgR family response regulator transcription factor n=1 Tax=Taibaiella koreensis TaxID=1268548 RepID=UPI000E59920F|nr:LytTR family DNA-binding domain-containing protein [Taibaiella koreensis]
MKYVCYVIDDEVRSITALERLIEGHPDLTFLGSDTQAGRALNRFRNGEIQADITFLDIEMPKTSGIEVQKPLSQFTTIVFVTAYPDFAAQAYDLDVVDYLVKPVSAERFNKCIDKVLSRLRERKSEEQYLVVYADQRKNKVRIKLEDILYLESADTYTQIKTVAGIHVAHHSMNYLEEALQQSDHFLRVHRSYMVNLKKLNSYSFFFIKLINGDRIPIGRKYREALKRKLGFG